MTRKDARAISKDIDTLCNPRITGLRRYGRGDWAIEAVDTITGYPFVIRSRDDWDERLARTN